MSNSLINFSIYDFSQSLYYYSVFGRNWFSGVRADWLEFNNISITLATLNESKLVLKIKIYEISTQFIYSIFWTERKNRLCCQGINILCVRSKMLMHCMHFIHDRLMNSLPIWLPTWRTKLLTNTEKNASAGMYAKQKNKTKQKTTNNQFALHHHFNFQSIEYMPYSPKFVRHVCRFACISNTRNESEIKIAMCLFSVYQSIYLRESASVKISSKRVNNWWSKKKKLRQNCKQPTLPLLCSIIIACV